MTTDSLNLLAEELRRWFHSAKEIDHNWIDFENEAKGILYLLGDASTRKDEGALTHADTAADSPCEIWDNAQSTAFNLAVDLGDKLFGMINATPESKYSWSRHEVSKTIEGEILKAMEPYLRTAESIARGETSDSNEVIKRIAIYLNGKYNHDLQCNWKALDVFEERAKELLAIIHDSLPEPVSGKVDLHEVRRQVWVNTYVYKESDESAEQWQCRVIKAVLDAAGVKYVD